MGRRPDRKVREVTREERRRLRELAKGKISGRTGRDGR